MTNPKEIIRLNKFIKNQEEWQKKNYTIIQQIKHYHSNEMVKLISYSMCRLSRPQDKVRWTRGIHYISR